MRSSSSRLERKITLLLCIILFFGVLSPWNTKAIGDAIEALLRSINELEITLGLEPTLHPDLVWEKIEFDNGDVYEGYINDETGACEGFGKYHWVDGDSYEGMRKDNKRTGYGIQRWAYGDSYEGMWKDDTASGFGMYHWADGISYIGMWKDSKISGFGIERYADGTLYVGMWKDNLKSGFGILRYADGNSYEGMWNDDARSGFGIQRWADGISHEGMWKDNLRSGFGIQRWADGLSYEGMWKDDVKSGFGIYIDSTNRKYYMISGESLEDAINGNIRVHWLDHSIQWGLYENNKPVDGMTKIEEQYEDWNGFRENLPLDDGSFYTGEYNTNGGDFVEGYGIMTYPDGSKYIGKFKEGFERDTSASGIFVSPDHEATEYKGSPDEYARIMPKPNP